MKPNFLLFFQNKNYSQHKTLTFNYKTQINITPLVMEI